MLVNKGLPWRANARTTIVANNPSPAVNEQIIVTVTRGIVSGFSCWEQGLGWDTGKASDRLTKDGDHAFRHRGNSRCLSAIQTSA